MCDQVRLHESVLIQNLILFVTWSLLRNADMHQLTLDVLYQQTIITLFLDNVLLMNAFDTACILSSSLFGNFSMMLLKPTIYPQQEHTIERS